jgi:hypothetical protein
VGPLPAATDHAALGRDGAVTVLITARIGACEQAQAAVEEVAQALVPLATGGVTAVSLATIVHDEVAGARPAGLAQEAGLDETQAVVSAQAP